MRPTPATNRSQASIIVPRATTATATMTDTSRPSWSCRAGGGPMMTAGTVSTGSASSTPVVSRPVAVSAVATVRGGLPGLHEHPALRDAAGGGTAGQHLGGGVPHHLRGGDGRPRGARQGDAHQHPQRGEAGELEAGQHQEPPGPDPTEVRPGAHQGDHAGQHDVQPERGDDGADGLPAPPPDGGPQPGHRTGLRPSPGLRATPSTRPPSTRSRPGSSPGKGDVQVLAVSPRTCMRSPGLPKMLSTSAGPSPVLPNQCGSRVSNSTTSPSPRTKSWSARTRRMRPDRT